jgi:hypothetical protein
MPEDDDSIEEEEIPTPPETETKVIVADEDDDAYNDKRKKIKKIFKHNQKLCLNTMMASILVSMCVLLAVDLIVHSARKK